MTTSDLVNKRTIIMKTQIYPQLFQSIQIGMMPRLSHRIVMAPLTRMRSVQPGDIPGILAVEYYAQRASEGGLIITEATTISFTGRGYLGAPGIYSDEQVAGWKKVTDAVHAKGGRIVLQLWHVGRASHVDMTGGQTPVGPSVVPYQGQAFTKNGWVPVSPNRALKTEEIAGIVDAFRRSARRAELAGFDAVEVHAANGYLLDQFLQDGSNKRTDAYGGSIENRARLLLEVTAAVISVWGKDRVGVRLGPNSIFNGMSDTNPDRTFGYAADELRKLGIAYLHLIEPRIDGNIATKEGLPPVAAARLKKIFKGIVMAAGGFEPDTAEEIIEKGDADLVAFGRHFISNPDLPSRIKLGQPLNPYDRATFYGGDARGYTDYPFYQGEMTHKPRALASIPS
jgi:N-ethylmaleimide reductase